MKQRAATSQATRNPSHRFRWTFPRWVLAQALVTASNGLESRDLLRLTRGQGAHPRAAIDALHAAGFIAVQSRSPRCFHAVMTDAGREALYMERIRRGGRAPMRGPVVPPRDHDGRLIFSYGFEPVASHAPGDLWRKTLALVQHIRLRHGHAPSPEAVANAS